MRALYEYHFNSGITLVASPLTINMSAFSNVAFFSLITNRLLWYFLSNERIGRREGTLLLFLNALFIAMSLGWIQIAQTYWAVVY